MNVSLDPRWQNFVDGVVREGRFASADDVVREGLRLVEANEAKLRALREHIEQAISDGGEHADEDVASAVTAALAEWRPKQCATTERIR